MHIKFPDFDIAKSFIAFKAFKAAGHSFLPGDLFDWQRLCITARKVTQFYDLRLITNQSDEILQHLEAIAMQKDVAEQVEQAKEAQPTGEAEAQETNEAQEAAAMATLAMATGIDLKKVEIDPEVTTEPTPEPVPAVEPIKKSKGK